MELAPGASDETVIWTCQSDWPNSGNCESNGLFYDVDKNTYLYSFYTNNSMVEVDRASGSSLWWAGNVSGGYSFPNGSTQFYWQHGVSWTDTGTLLLSSYAQGTTRAIEYQVDHSSQTVTEVWSFNPGVEAQTNGDTWRLSNGNTLHLVGSAGQLNEISPSGSSVWKVDFGGGQKLLGRGELIEDLYNLVKP